MPFAAPHATQTDPVVDDPIELLLACHEKVRRFTALSLKLQAHVGAQGADAQAADAAHAILRYFDVAAPLHHADEEEDLYPALLTLGDADLSGAVLRIQAEHTELNRLWQGSRPWLMQVSDGHASAPPSSLADFARAYEQHAAEEEATLFPQAQRLSGPQRQAICAAMVARRTA